MNYRHQFHAGNYADVMKHALLAGLFRHLQKKEKGFLFLDTHAGRGRYDLARAAEGESLARTPEWPDGIGRLWSRAEGEMPADLSEYLKRVRQFDQRLGNLEATPRFYPGSPWIARVLARAGDRIALYEKHPPECAALRHDFEGAPRISVHEADGYSAIRAVLPPAERRALVLIDPPFEEQDEFASIARALKTMLERFPSSVVATWYPLTVRARVNEFFAAVQALNPPSALINELFIASESSNLKMKGCGLLVINPPWQFEREASALLAFLSALLAQEPGGGSRVEWLVRERGG